MNGPRIFVNEFGGVRAPGETTIADYEADPAWTEVKLVPLDAVVIDRRMRFTSREDAAERVRAFARLVDLRVDDRDPSPGVLALVRGTAEAVLEAVAHMDAHPPVDEVQVQAVKEALLAARVTGSRYDEAVTADARRLVERGVRVEVSHDA